MPDAGVLVVGGGLAGCTAAKTMEEAGRGAEVLVIDPDRLAPYDRPPLTKALLATGDRLVQRPAWAPEAVAWRRDCVVTVDVNRRAVQLASGEVLTAETVVLAAGGLARRLPGRRARALTVRTAADAWRIRDAWDAGARRFLVEGAGPLGLELASTLAEGGAHVVVVDPAAAPMERLLGGLLADEVQGWAHGAGVRLLLRTVVASVADRDEGLGVDAVIGEGGAEAFEVMVSAVGSEAAPLPLVSSAGPLRCAMVDERCRLLDGVGKVVDGVYAVGDLAVRRQPDGTVARREAWTSAKVDGELVARQILGGPLPAEPVPYFWTRQFGRMVQILGSVSPRCEAAVVAEVERTGGRLYRVTDEDATVGYVGVNAQRLVAMLQTQPGSVAEWAPPEI